MFTFKNFPKVQPVFQGKNRLKNLLKDKPLKLDFEENFLIVVKKFFEENFLNIVNDFQRIFLLVQVQTLFQLGFFVDHQHFILCGILCKTRYSKSLIESGAVQNYVIAHLPQILQSLRI